MSYTATCGIEYVVDGVCTVYAINSYLIALSYFQIDAVAFVDGASFVLFKKAKTR